MANRQIFELNSRTLATTDVLPTQDAAGSSEAGQNTVQDIIDLITIVPTASYALNAGATPGGNDGDIQYNDNGTLAGVPDLTYSNGLLAATGSFYGNLSGVATSADTAESASHALMADAAITAETASYVQTAVSALTASYVQNAQTASFINLTAGPGISINGLAITASVRTVNGKFPTANGNIEATLSSTKTGTSASLVSSGSGAVTASIPDGTVWIIANDPTPTNNGLVYIYSSGSVGRWYPIAPLDAAAIEAAYVRLDGTNGPMQGNLAFGGNDITGVDTLAATTLSGSLNAAYISGPHGASSVASASRAETASYALSGVPAFPYTGSARITGSLGVNTSLVGRSGILRANFNALSGSPANRNLPGGYSVYDINPNESSNGESKLTLWPLSTTPTWLEQITIASSTSSNIISLSGSATDRVNGGNGISIRPSEYVTLAPDLNGFLPNWRIVSRGRYAETVISNGSTTAIQTITGSLIVSGSGMRVTGSVNVTGSLTVNGAYISDGALIASFGDLSGSSANRNLPGGYSVYSIYANEQSNNQSRLRLWPLSTTPNWVGPITIAASDGSYPITVSGSAFDTIGQNNGLILQPNEYVTLYPYIDGGDWSIQARGRVGETVISNGAANAVQTITGSLIVSGSGMRVTGSVNVSGSLTVNGVSVTGGGGAAFPYNGAAVITGSLLVSGSGMRVTGSTQISGSLVVNGPVTIGSLLQGDNVDTTQNISVGSLSAAMDVFSGSFANRTLPTGYRNYYIYLNESSNNTCSLNLPAASDAAKYSGPVTIVSQFNSNNTRIRYNNQTVTTISEGPSNWVTLFYDSYNNEWVVLDKGRSGETIISNGAIAAIQTITGSLIVSGSGMRVTGSVNVSGSLTVNGVSVTGGGGAAFPYTGSAQITGSLIVTGSTNVTGSINVSNNVIADVVAGATTRGNTVYTIPPDGNVGTGQAIEPYYAVTNQQTVWDAPTSYTQVAVPAIRSYGNGLSSGGSGGYSRTTQFGHTGIGTFEGIYNQGLAEFTSLFAPAVFLHTSNTSTPNPPQLATNVTRTVISDNRTLDMNSGYTVVSNAYTANGRTHVLTVTGSFLARDGVSIGTSISNQHFITGSVNVTGSLTVNGVSVTGGGAAFPFNGDAVVSGSLLVSGSGLTVSGSTNISGSLTVNGVSVGGSPYKVYSAIVKYVGGSLQLVQELQNTLGATITFANLVSGIDSITASSPVFTTGKTTGIGASYHDTGASNLGRCTSITTFSTTVLTIKSFQPSTVGTSVINNIEFFIEIRVYN